MANGFPPLLNKINNIVNIAVLAVADAILIYQQFQRPSWGIFNAGTNFFAIIPDSIVSVDFQRQWAIASYPMEQGAFQNYNKVQFPFENRVQLTKGGSVKEKQQFLNIIESMAASLDLFDIVTPERTYYNVNVENISYDRSSASGAGLLTINLDFQEIRFNAIAKFNNTIDANASDPVSDGTVQTTAIAPQSPLSTLTPI